jgi:hypothetical protein
LQYYKKLATAKFGLSLPGLGYDCFRLWELLTMGTIAVIERMVGLDKTTWRLPVILLEDFYDLNPEVLRQAYIEVSGVFGCVHAICSVYPPCVVPCIFFAGNIPRFISCKV